MLPRPPLARASLTSAPAVACRCRGYGRRPWLALFAAAAMLIAWQPSSVCADEVQESHYPNGNLQRVVRISGNKQHDILYFPNGHRMLEATTVDGLPSGTMRLYHHNGNEQVVGAFDKGKETGVWRMYHPNGKLAARANFRDGKMYGRYTGYHPNGQIAAVGEASGASYRAMNPPVFQGLWFYFHAHGDVRYAAIYRDGQVIQEVPFEIDPDTGVTHVFLEDPDGSTRKMRVDAKGNLHEPRDPLALDSERLIEVTIDDDTGAMTIVREDEHGVVTATTGQKTTLEDGSELIVEVDDQGNRRETLIAPDGTVTVTRDIDRDNEQTVHLRTDEGIDVVARDADGGFVFTRKDLDGVITIERTDAEGARIETIAYWPDGAIEWVEPDGTWHRAFTDENGHTTFIKVDPHGNSVTTVYDGDKVVQHTWLGAKPPEPGRDLYEREHEGSNWDDLPDWMKEDYAAAEWARQTSDRFRAISEAADGRERLAEVERRRSQAEAEEEIAAIRAEQEEANRRSAELAAKDERRRQVWENLETGRKLRQQYEEAVARGDEAEARRIGVLQDKHHEASMELLAFTHAEQEEMARREAELADAERRRAEEARITAEEAAARRAERERMTAEELAQLDTYERYYKGLSAILKDLPKAQLEIFQEQLNKAVDDKDGELVRALLSEDRRGLAGLLNRNPKIREMFSDENRGFEKVLVPAIERGAAGLGVLTSGRKAMLAVEEGDYVAASMAFIDGGVNSYKMLPKSRQEAIEAKLGGQVGPAANLLKGVIAFSNEIVREKTDDDPLNYGVLTRELVNIMANGFETIPPAQRAHMLTRLTGNPIERLDAKTAGAKRVAALLDAAPEIYTLYNEWGTSNTYINIANLAEKLGPKVIGALVHAQTRSPTAGDLAEFIAAQGTGYIAGLGREAREANIAAFDAATQSSAAYAQRLPNLRQAGQEAGLNRSDNITFTNLRTVIGGNNTSNALFALQQREDNANAMREAIAAYRHLNQLTGSRAPGVTGMIDRFNSGDVPATLRSHWMADARLTLDEVNHMLGRYDPGTPAHQFLQAYRADLIQLLRVYG